MKKYKIKKFGLAWWTLGALAITINYYILYILFNAWIFEQTNIF